MVCPSLNDSSLACTVCSTVRITLFKSFTFVFAIY